MLKLLIYSEGEIIIKATARRECKDVRLRRPAHANLEL